MGERPALLHIVGDSKYGGGALVVLQLARLARDMGCEPFILATDPPFQQAIHHAGVGLIDLDVIWRDIRPWRDLKGLWRLYRFLKHARFSVVHTHTSKAGFVGRLAARLAGVPVVVHTVHGFPFHEESSRLQLMVYSTLERIAARWCDRIVCVSEFHARVARRLRIGRPGQVIAVCNGVAECPQISPARRQRLRAEMGLRDEDELVIFSAGRLATQKGFEYLIGSAARLSQILSRPFQIWIAGEGPLRSVLEAAIRRHRVDSSVRLLGFRTDVLELLQACDVVALPSLWEGLSIALLEAMSAGKPIVATRIGSNLEVARHGRVALLVPRRDPVALAHAIQRFADEPGLAEIYGWEARRVLMEHYPEDRLLEGYRKVYLDLLDPCAISFQGVAVPAGAGNEHTAECIAVHQSNCGGRLQQEGGAVLIESNVDAVSGLEPRARQDTQVIRPADRNDLSAITQLHIRAFGSAFLARLGPGFLMSYYRRVMEYGNGILLVAAEGSSIAGFAAGFLKPHEFYQYMLHHRWRFAWPVLSGLLRSPGLVPHAVSGVDFVVQSALPNPSGAACELSSIAVDPSVVGKGLGNRLLHAFLALSAERGAEYVYLTTDALNLAANLLYRRNGFELVQTFHRGRHREMHEYVYYFH